jgi:hypothetical protein
VCVCVCVCACVCVCVCACACACECAWACVNGEVCQDDGGESHGDGGRGSGGDGGDGGCGGEERALVRARWWRCEMTTYVFETSCDIAALDWR